uniref:Uncharacterized protein n=1 Tax=Anguilla anguilla TaxID=7936 RepID=A0A0E9PBY1_ANGAN
MDQAAKPCQCDQSKALLHAFFIYVSFLFYFSF